MIIFKKWKEFKEKYKRHCDKYTVLDYTYDYKNVVIRTPHIIAGTIYIIKDSSYGLIFFVKKDNWKKYIGVNRNYLSDSQGNDFPKDSLYKTDNLSKRIVSCYESSIPKELIKETEDELIKYKDDIKESLEIAIKEEFYK